jgi:hypothetical protein
MKTHTVAGMVLGGIAVLLGAGVLYFGAARQAGVDSTLLNGLSLTWLFGLWSWLVVAMVFLITWTADAMAESQAETATHLHIVEATRGSQRDSALKAS